MLEQIILHKREVLKHRASEIHNYKHKVLATEKSLKQALIQHKRAFICEIKLASPSLGLLRKNADIGEIGRIYAPFADAMSVLAEEKFFLGALSNVKKISEEQACPILCKDVVVSPLQVYEARYHGADALLLMLSVLDDKTYKQCADLAHELNMSVICEVHNEEEVIRANNLKAPIIGINNRNLFTLTIDLETTKRLRPLVHKNALVIAESGFVNHEQIERYADLVDGFLIGSSLMRASRIDLAVRELIFGRVKICGLSNAKDARFAYECGAYYGGLNFSPLSKRLISIDEAKNIISSAPLSYGGIFVNQPIDYILHIAQELRLNFIQLHGDEQKDYRRELKRLLAPDCEIWQALRVKDTINNNNINADRIVLDSYNPQAHGGTGTAFDWSLCKELHTSFGLAGGINKNNIKDAIKLNPFVIDIASGVEDSDCRNKSHEKLKEIFSILRGN
jgi:indole-3-glycerol phosphate synthase/phosphoribosylanthranilate isomerase